MPAGPALAIAASAASVAVCTDDTKTSPWSFASRRPTGEGGPPVRCGAVNGGIRIDSY